MRNNTIKFYRKVQARYKRLYDQERIRHDDVIERLMDEYDKSDITIYRILRTDLPDVLPVKNPLQTELFIMDNG